jgi:ABC-type Fe3+/spermidine/putrescine transport system ATPase subunit
VLVTHDPEEAALLADELLVIDHGRILQQGPVAQVLTHPASPQVAALLGVANAHGATVSAPGVIRAGALELPAPTGDLPAGTGVSWSIRPEDVALNGTSRHRATVLDTVTLGATTELTLALDGLELVARTVHGPSLRIGDRVAIDLPAQAITVWPAGGGEAAPPR